LKVDPQQINLKGVHSLAADFAADSPRAKGETYEYYLGSAWQKPFGQRREAADLRKFLGVNEMDKNVERFGI